MPSVEQLRELVLKMREGLALIDEKRQVVVEAIANAEELIKAVERAEVKA